LTVFWLRSTLYRDTAPVPFINFLQPKQLLSYLSKLYRDTRNAQSNLYLDGKKCVIPSLHRDNFLAKVPGPCPGLSSGNTTSLYCRAVMFKPIATKKIIISGLLWPKHNGSSNICLIKLHDNNNI